MELRRLKCLYSDVHIHAKVMGTLVYLICIRCVGGLSATSWEVQILFVVLVSQSTLTTLMELVLHVILMNRQVTLPQHAPVSLGALVEIIFPYLWGRATSVRQV